MSIGDFVYGVLVLDNGRLHPTVGLRVGPTRTMVLRPELGAPWWPARVETFRVEATLRPAERIEVAGAPAFVIPPRAFGHDLAGGVVALITGEDAWDWFPSLDRAEAWFSWCC